MKDIQDLHRENTERSKRLYGEVAVFMNWRLNYQFLEGVQSSQNQSFCGGEGVGGEINKLISIFIWKC